MKNGFILNFAYCANCSWRQEYKRINEQPIFPLKEILSDVVGKMHDSDQKPYCTKTNLRISYTNCLYEE